ncbi:MAG: acyltransferase family protein [Bacillota bacterium]|jgi:hypothetical protein
MEGKALFSRNLVNKGRQVELDVVKGLAIVFMVLVHCLEEYTVWPLPGTLSTYIIEFLGSPPAAPVFMFALGIGIVYSRKSDARSLLKRGIWLLALGYILSFFRDLLPHLVLYAKTQDSAYYSEGIQLFLGIDILQFAALTFIFFGIATALRFKPLSYFIAALILAGINLAVAGISPENEVLRIFLGLFWGTNEYAWFPFLVWIIYPIGGYLFGNLLIRCNNKGQFYKQVFAISLAILALFGLYSYLSGVDFGAHDGLYQEAYYHHDLIGNIILLAFVGVWTSLIYFLTAFLPKFITGALARWSKNITTIYCVHWLIIGWSLIFMPPLSLPWLLLTFALIHAASDIISIYYLQLKTRVVARLQGKSLNG